MDDGRPSLRSVDHQLSLMGDRIDKIEKRDIEADIIHRELQRNDGETAKAVYELAKTINDPRSGLIVELERFRTDVAADRRTFKAWVGGATFVLGIIMVFVNLFAPAIRSALGIP